MICRGPPFGFDAKLSEAYPDLYQKLKEAKDSGKLHACYAQLFPMYVGQGLFILLFNKTATFVIKYMNGLSCRLVFSFQW